MESLLKCEICQEAYFTTEESKMRHQQMCLAVKVFSASKVFKGGGGGRVVLQQEEHQTTSHTSEPIQKGAKRQVVTSSVEEQQKKKKNEIKSTSTESTSWDFAGYPKYVAGDSPLIASAQSSGNQPPKLRYSLKTGLTSARDFTIVNPNMYYKDIPTFLEAAFSVIAGILLDEQKSSSSLKYNIVLEAMYNHPQQITEEFNFKTRTKALYKNEDELLECLTTDKAKLLEEESLMEGKHSGWSLDHPTRLTLRVSRFKYKNAAARGFVDLPGKLKSRKATVNVQNKNDECFRYSMLVKHLPYPVDCSTVLNENSFSELNDVYCFNGIKFPTSVNEIKKFEKLNPNTSVNVFEAGKSGEITPLRVVEEKEDHTDLLLYRDGNGPGHYIYIVDFAKLIRPQIARGTNQITVCKRCSAYNETRKCKPDPKTWLKEHLRLCVSHTPTIVRLPKEGENILKFEQYETEIPVPIIIVADFEATLVPIPGSDGSYQCHEPNSYCTLVKSNLSDDILLEAGISTTPYVYRSYDAGRNFLRHMKELAEKIESLYLRQTPLAPMTAEEVKRHEEAYNCDLCEKSFNDSTCVKVLDHDHITGKYRYSLCSRCNLRCAQPNFVPVYFHNLSNYDANFIIKNLGAVAGSEVKVIPATNEKFISVSIRIGRLWLRFLDSFRLMSDSLAKLVSILADDEFIESSKLVPPQYTDLIKRKNCYPYDYVKTVDVFNETCLPSREAFYNQLNEEECSEEDYQFAQSVWNKLEMKTFGDYHDFYLKLDCCLLADTLTSFRKTCLSAYRIDCAHMYTSPGLAYQAMLRMTRVNLELITCPDMMLMFEAGIRGGLVQCSLRHAKANNPLLSNPNDYDSGKESSYILMLDCVNLYGKSLTQPLPVGNFKFVDNPSEIDWSSLPVDSPHGYILEADVEYPENVHDRLQDLPPLPMLESPPGEDKTKKLLATLTNKSRYIAHYTVFQQALRLNLKVTNVYRAISFSQAPFMKRYIEYNSNRRAESKNPFYSNLFKGQNNAAYGRLLLSKRHHRDVRIVTTERALEKLTRQPRFAEHVIISPNVVAVYMHKKTVTLNAPIYAGMCVLDISKTHMYNFFYNVLKKHLKAPECDVRLCYTDTDSLMLYIKTKSDIYEILKRPAIAQHLDQSVYPDGHPLKDIKNKGRIGCFKDEAHGGKQIQEYIGLRAKMYAYRYSSSEDDAKSTAMKAKGLKKSYVLNQLRFDNYKQTLFTDIEVKKAEFNLIRSKGFRLTSGTTVKKSLSAADNKRYILENSHTTLPYGHYRLKTLDAEEDSDSDENSK